MADQGASISMLVEGAFATKMSTAASFAFLLYDYVLNIELERKFVWERKWTYGQMVFIFNRYFGIIALLFNLIVIFSGSLSNEFCNHFVKWEATSQITAVTSVAVILQFRIYAVYNKSRKILFAMIALSLSAVVSALSIVYSGLPDGFALGSSGLTGCYIIVPRLLFLCWLPGLISETILCLLMLYKARQEYRFFLSTDSKLHNTIVRDSALYFFTIFSVLLANCLIWILGNQISTEVALGWEIAVPCAVGSRLFINMRERAASLSDSTGGVSHVISEIRFREEVVHTRNDEYTLVMRDVVREDV